jgi:hypothetical protein
MGNRISRKHLIRFIDDNTHGESAVMVNDDYPGSLAWLSYLCLHWVWPNEVDPILKTLRKARRHGESFNEKSVVDVVKAAKIYRGRRGMDHMSEEEEMRFRVFSSFRKSQGSFRYPVISITHPYTGHVQEYIRGRRFMNRYD